MRRVLPALVLLAVCAGPPTEGPAGVQGGAVGTPTSRSDDTPSAAVGASVRMLFAGDVMLGRGVAQIESSEGPLAGIRWPVADADLAVANLESPLTLRAHDPSSGPNALEAPPYAAVWLSAAGFDAMGLANNHAGDAGPATVSDTMSALAHEGLVAVGAGRDENEAFSARVREVGGIRVALLAFDATGQGPKAGASGQGVARWDETLVRNAVARARASADLVAVGLHGGTEYVPAPDPYVLRLARTLARLGVDIVWGHGPHVIQPIRAIDPDGDGRPTIVAPSLGNLLFDQHVPGTRRGALLEVLAGRDGVRAFRVGTAEHRDGPASFRGWRPPRGDAVALGGGWWELARPVAASPAARAEAPDGFEGDVMDAALGDPDGDGRRDLVVAFRRPFSWTSVNALVPRERLVDTLGRTAHVGLYRPGDLRPRWVAGTLLRPVAALAACDGSLAVGYSTLDAPDVLVATGAWEWGGFGFVQLRDLPGEGTPSCAEVDGDGRADPTIVGRSER